MRVKYLLAIEGISLAVGIALLAVTVPARLLELVDELRFWQLMYFAQVCFTVSLGAAVVVAHRIARDSIDDSLKLITMGKQQQDINERLLRERGILLAQREELITQMQEMRDARQAPEER